MSSIYSNVDGDFSATPNAGTKTITFADFANGVISGDLSMMNFIRAEVYEIFANGGVFKIPLTSLAFDTDTLTINNMTAVFKDGDTVAVYIEGRDKGFDEAADKYKTDGGGGGGTGDVNLIEVGGVAFALGQALAAGSLPAVLPAAQITTLTPPAAITNYALESGGALDEISSSSAAAAASLDVLDSIVELGRAAANIISGQVGVQGGSGSVSANTQRVVLATDVPLPTGTNSIGQVTANAGTNLNTSTLALEAGGNLAAIAATKVAGSFYMSSALAGSGVVKASAGTLFACNGRLDQLAATGQYFLQFYNSASVPADGAVTILHCETIEHLNNYSTGISFEYPRGKIASTGISYALSTTEFTKTLAGVNYLSLEVEYK